MIPDNNVHNNVERFSGFEDEYNRYRPEAPSMVIDLLVAYLGKRPSTLVDLGCGTGLSSFIWKEKAGRIIGVEPNDDMRSKALAVLAQMPQGQNISFVKGYSNETHLEANSVDIVTCSQSFHWMEPVSTLQEVDRLLSDGGVFAAFDCDWPPTVQWEIEQQYTRLMEKVEALIQERDREENKTKKWPKHEHLKNIAQSGLFRFTKEVVFHNRERCDAERYVGLALSQGGLQSVKKSGWTDLDSDIEAFRQAVQRHFSDRTLDIVFSYRMRLGIK